VIPNADGAGYYRFSLDRAAWTALIANAAHLTPREILAALGSLEAAFASGNMSTADYLDRVQELLKQAGDLPPYDVLSQPMSRLAWIKNRLAPQWRKDGARNLVAALYRPVYDKLGLDPITPLDETDPYRATLTRTP